MREPQGSANSGHSPVGYDTGKLPVAGETGAIPRAWAFSTGPAQTKPKAVADLNADSAF
jgi:hypothetical protein